MRIGPRKRGSSVSSSQTLNSVVENTGPGWNGGASGSACGTAIASSAPRSCLATYPMREKVSSRRKVAIALIFGHPWRSPAISSSSRARRAAPCGPTPPQVCQPIGAKSQPHPWHSSSFLSILSFSACFRDLRSRTVVQVADGASGWWTTRSIESSDFSRGHALTSLLKARV